MTDGRCTLKTLVTVLVVVAGAVATLMMFTALASAEPAKAPKLTEAELAQVVETVEILCPLLEDEAMTLDLIAREKRNPSGVVSLRALHELGAALQQLREQLAIERVERKEGLRLFRKATGKALGLPWCLVNWHPEESS
jgi:hypothetical protein